MQIRDRKTKEILSKRRRGAKVGENAIDKKVDKNKQRRRRRRVSRAEIKRERQEKHVLEPTIIALKGMLSGQDVFVVGTGWSMKGFRWDLLRGRATIALNDAVFPVPEPSVHLFADTAITKRYVKHPYHPDTKIVCQGGSLTHMNRAAFKYRSQVYFFRNYGKPDGIIERDKQLYVSRTVATGGIVLAYKLGARRVFLLGVDACRPDGSDEYYYDGSGKKPEHKKRGKSSVQNGLLVEPRHVQWARNMSELKIFFATRARGGVYSERWPGSGVYNLSPVSTIDAWEKVPAATIFEEDPWLNLDRTT